MASKNTPMAVMANEATVFRLSRPLSEIQPEPRRPHKSAAANAESKTTAMEISMPRSTAKSTTTMTNVVQPQVNEICVQQSTRKCGFRTSD